MPVEMTDQEKRIEREQVEWVFRLTGGELSDKPWHYIAEKVSHVDGKPFTPPGERVPMDEIRACSFSYHYDGPPEYAAGDYRDESRDLCTVVTCALYGMPPAVLWDASTGDRWARIADFRSSGETECPGQHEEENLVSDAHTAGGDRCVLCEAEKGELHGMIYIGDGWVEAVYVKETPILHFEIRDHGCDGEQYFPGCGVAFSPYSNVVTGIGVSAREAAEDALSMMDVDASTDALEEEIRQLSDAPSFDVNDPEISPEWHHYVSIRWRVERS